MQGAVMRAMDYDLMEDALGDDAANRILEQAIDQARANATAGVELVRIQHVPKSFGSNGFPATWAIEVLGVADRR